MFIINFCLNMFRASLCTSSGEQRPCYCIWCVVLVLLDVVGSGCGALSWRKWALYGHLLQNFEIWCWKMMANVSWTDQVRNEEELRKAKEEKNMLQSMKREDQQVATIRCLLLTSVSTCFGHHYAHLQENKGPVTALLLRCRMRAVLASYKTALPTTCSRTSTIHHMQ